VSYTAPDWSPTINYNAYNFLLIKYGVNTAPANSYPNNIFFASNASPTPPVVGVPPTSTPAPYPALPTVNPGWLLASVANFVVGSSVVDENGAMAIRATFIQANAPATTTFFGGGGETVGLSIPRGVTIQEADITTLSGNNGALLDVAGVMKADGVYIHNTDQALAPASSANSNVANFTLGTNYTWTAPVAPATAWTWAGAAGTAGSTTLTGPANSMPFDPQCMMMITRKFIAGATHAIGNLCVDSKGATSVVISSRASTDQSLVAADVGAFEWICFNPNWTS
jgi:hypothetical protein